MKASVKLSQEDIDRCLQAYNDAVWVGKTYSFDPVNTGFVAMEQLRKERISIMAGELAFAKFLRRNIGVINKYEDIFDYNREWSTLPVAANRWLFQIKPIVCRKYMYIPWSELKARHNAGMLPHSYVLCEVEWSEENNEPLGNVEIYGMMSLKKVLLKHKELYITKGQEPGSDTIGPGPADCYRVNKLSFSEDWGHNVYHCLKNEPQDTSKYPAPYIIA